MKSATRSPAIRRAVEKARRLGFSVEFVEIVPTAAAPMLIPAQGLCDHERKIIRVATPGNSRQKLAAILEHEIEHAEGKEHGTDRPEFGLKCGGTLQANGLFSYVTERRYEKPSVPLTAPTLYLPAVPLDLEIEAAWFSAFTECCDQRRGYSIIYYKEQDSP